MIKLIIDDIPPSNNKYMGRGGKQNHKAYKAEKLKWEWLIKASATHIRKEQLKGVTVQITYYFPTRVRRDPDNYSGKFILDGLVRCGILEDDSFDCINLMLASSVDKANPRTEIEISEV